MKKNLCAVFLLLVFLVSVPCVSSAMTQEEGEQFIHDMFADSSDEDLKNLFEAVQFELVSRGYKFDFDETHQAASTQKEDAVQKEVTVPPGTYSVGSDIPAGTYTVVTNGIISMLTVKNSSGGYVTMHSLNNNTQVGKLVLEAGQTVEIVGESVIFKPFQGLGF